MPFSPPTAADDRAWMQLALDQAQLGLGCTSPNPPVGALIIQHRSRLQDRPPTPNPSPPIRSDWQLIGASYHQRAGEPHAERRALADAYERGYSREELIGACIYVTLEPCSSWGRTPPCTDAIIQAQLGRVVYACSDPDKRHQGRAKQILEQEGIEVLEGVFKDYCERMLRPWFFAIEHGRPWVVAKVASSLDGALSRRETSWLSCKESLHFAHQLRAQSDAILVGGGTLRRDDPSLTIRLPEGELSDCKVQPWRVLVTTQEQADGSKKLFCDEHADRTLIYKDIADWEQELLIPLFRDHGVVTLMLECGGDLLTQWLAAGLIQEWVQIITPHLSGGPHRLLTGQDYLLREPRWREASWRPLGSDMLYRALVDNHDRGMGKI